MMTNYMKIIPRDNRNRNRFVLTTRCWISGSEKVHDSNSIISVFPKEDPRKREGYIYSYILGVSFCVTCVLTSHEYHQHPFFDDSKRLLLRSWSLSQLFLSIRDKMVKNSFSFSSDRKQMKNCMGCEEIDENGAKTQLPKLEPKPKCHELIIEGDESKVREFLDMYPAEIDSCDSMGISPLMCSIKNGRREIAFFLLHRNNFKDLRQIDRHGWTCLHWASDREDLGLVQLIIARDPYISSLTDIRGLNSLHIACWRGNLPIVKCLLDVPCSAVTSSAVTKWGELPAHHAAYFGHKDIISLLVTQGPPSQLTQIDRLGRTPEMLLKKMDNSKRILS